MALPAAQKGRPRWWRSGFRRSGATGGSQAATPARVAAPSWSSTRQRISRIEMSCRGPHRFPVRFAALALRFRLAGRPLERRADGRNAVP